MIDINELKFYAIMFLFLVGVVAIIYLMCRPKNNPQSNNKKPMASETDWGKLHAERQAAQKKENIGKKINKTANEIIKIVFYCGIVYICWIIIKAIYF